MTLPWYRRFPDNFIAGTVGLSLEEKGAYSLVLDLIYVRGGPVPDEARYIAGVCNCSVRKWNAIRQRLIDLGKITLIEGYLTNHRAEEEIAIAGKISREAIENGSKGGNKSAEIRSKVKKNNALAQASLKLSTTTAIKKEGATRSDPTDGLARVDKHLEPELFDVLVALNPGDVRSWAEHWSWPAKLVAETRARLAGKVAA